MTVKFALVLAAVLGAVSLSSTMSLFSVNVANRDGDHLVTTGPRNYAIAGPGLQKKNWRTVSVNGDQVKIVTTEGDRLEKKKSDLGEDEYAFIEKLRDDIAESKSSSIASPDKNSGSYMMSSAYRSGHTFSSSDGGSYMSSGGDNLVNFNMNGLAVSMRDKDHFSVSKTDMPYGWHRMELDGDVVTIVMKSGDVYSEPLSMMKPEEASAVEALRAEVCKLHEEQAKNLAHTMQTSTDMIHNIFQNVMSSMPRPPDFGSMGGMFGETFPFGSMGSPFSASASWPFGHVVASAGPSSFSLGRS